MNLKTYNKLNFPLYTHIPCHLNIQYFLNEIRGGNDKSYMFVNLNKKLLKKLFKLIAGKNSKKLLGIVMPAIKEKKIDNEIINLLMPYAEDFSFKFHNKNIINEIIKSCDYKKIIEISPLKNLLTDHSTEWYEKYSENIDGDLFVIWGKNIYVNKPKIWAGDYIISIEYKDMYILRNFILNNILGLNIPNYKYNEVVGKYHQYIDDCEIIYSFNIENKHLYSTGISFEKKNNSELMSSKIDKF